MENKPGEPDSNKEYGTFKSTAPAVPGSVAANSAFRKDSVGAARGGSAQYGDPNRATTEQNNATGNWTAMSQTTIVLGTDGNTSVQPGTLAGVSELNEPFPCRRSAGVRATGLQAGVVCGGLSVSLIR